MVRTTPASLSKVVLVLSLVVKGDFRDWAFFLVPCFLSPKNISFGFGFYSRFKRSRPGIVVHACNPSTQEAEAGRS
jgi:hypothetical protein